MDSIYRFIIFFILIIFGLNLSANNLVHSIIVKYFFYNMKFTNVTTRLMGILLLASSYFVIIGQYDLCLLIVLFVIIIFIFLTIRGRSQAMRDYEKIKKEKIDMYVNEVENRKRKIVEIRSRLEHEKTASKLSKKIY